MKILLDNDQILVACQYHEKDIIKAIGDYQWLKSRNLWRFPQKKLIPIIERLNITYDNEVKVLYERLLQERNEREAELKLANQIKANSSNNLTNFFESQPKEAFYLLLKLFHHQKKALALASLFDSYALFLETGCVSGDTEYLTPNGWKRFDSYTVGDLVAQYDLKKQKAEFVLPIKYIKAPCEGMYYLKTLTGINQLLSPEHRVLSYWATTNKPYSISAMDLYQRHQRNRKGCKLRVLTAFELKTKGQIDLSENKLRLQIAVMADGHFPNKTNKCRLRLKKEKKIERLKQLLQRTDSDYKIHIDTDGQSSFTFQAPIRTKYFTQDFWKASFEQRKIICDEVKYWDASIRKNNRGVQYFCQNQSDADFIQYCFTSTGQKARITSVDRGYKNRSYTVSVIGTGIKENYAHIGYRKNNVTLVPSPDGYKYCFEVPSTYLILRRNGCIFITGNTGKTLVAIRLVQLRKVPTMIVAPLSTLSSVWEEEIQKWSNLSYENLWQNLDRIKINADIYLINYEHFKKLHKNGGLPEKIKFLIIDESSKLKAPRTQITKTILAYKDTIPYRLILSGLPAPNNLLEFWGQMAYINSDLLGDNFWRFRNTYFLSVGYGGFMYVPHHGAKEVIMSKVSEQAYFIKKSECLDLPDRMFETRSMEMDDLQRKQYNIMLKENIMEFKNHTTLGVNELAKIMKLRQITSGFSITTENISIDLSDSKLIALKDILEEIGIDKQVIIWIQFHHEVTKIKDYLKKQPEFQNIPIATLYGLMPQKEKKKAIQDFQNNRVRYLLAHPKSGGFGLNFSNCSYAVWFSISYSSEEHSQANDRIYRIGQVNKCTYIYLFAKKSIDEVIYKALRKKIKMSDACLNMLKGQSNAI